MPPILTAVIVGLFAFFKLFRQYNVDYVVLLTLSVLVVPASTLFAYGALLGWARLRRSIIATLLLRVGPGSVVYAFLLYLVAWLGFHHFVTGPLSGWAVLRSGFFVLIGTYASLGLAYAAQAAGMADRGQRVWLSSTGERVWS